MELLDLHMWPMWIGGGVLAAAALFNCAADRRVPNALTLPAIVIAWTLALLQSLFDVMPNCEGGLTASMAAAFAGGILLVPFYTMQMLGAGCVKAQTAFGAWLGCAVGAGAALLLVIGATIAGGIVTFVCAWAYSTRLSSTADSEPSQIGLFPAQVTLSIGSMLGLIVVYHFAG